MFKHKPVVACLTAVMFLGACATTPMGPMVQVMPDRNKPFQVFVDDQASCKKYAEEAVKGQADAANNRAVGAAILGVALGAVLGAAIGNHYGAGVGASTGAIAGTGAGTTGSQVAQFTIQQQYDNAYSQCMYSRGNQVAGFEPAGAPAPSAPRL